MDKLPSRLLHEALFPTLTGHWTYANLNDEAFLICQQEPNPLLDPAYCEKWVNNLHVKWNADYSFGGYLENRKDIWRGHYHQPGHTFHLGVDFNVPAGTRVCLPVSAELVHVELDQDHNGGWGGKLIFAWEGFHFLLGHLDGLRVEAGRKYRKRKILGFVGNFPYNGNWFPHLHLQVMREFRPDVDGYMSWYDGIRDDFPHPEILMRGKRHGKTKTEDGTGKAVIGS